MHQINKSIILQFQGDAEAAKEEVEWMEKIAREGDWLGALPQSILMGLAFKYNAVKVAKKKKPVEDEFAEPIKKTTKKKLVAANG